MADISESPELLPKTEPEPLGPVEFLLLGFQGNKFNADIAPAISDLVERGLVRILDLALVMKDADGESTSMEMQELPDDVAEALRTLTGDMRGLLSEADLAQVAESLENSTSVLTILVEHIWASRFAGAVQKAGGKLLISERISHELIEQGRETLGALALAADGEAQVPSRKGRPATVGHRARDAIVGEARKTGILTEKA